MPIDISTLDGEAWQDVARRSRQACVVFTDQVLPAGCRPATARIGIEQRADGRAALLVDRSLAYLGADPAVAGWVSTGVREFTGVAELRDWLVAVLAPVSGDEAAPGDGAPSGGDGVAGRPGPRPGMRPGPRPRPAADLVDLGRVAAPPPPRRPRIDAEELGQLLGEEVLGQGLAIRQVAGLTSRHVAKSAPRRPLTMLFTGATGVGKTLLASGLADALTELSGQHWGFLRLDANELAEAHTVSRIVGAPPGYRGHGDGHDLASSLSRSPRQVVLLDEIDKAHPDVLQVLMNLLDTGVLRRDGGQRHGDLRSGIVVLTSNGRSRTSERALHDLDWPDRPASPREQLVAEGLPPEIAARITSVVTFAPLGLDSRAAIAVLAIRRVAESYGVTLTSIDPPVVSRLLACDQEDGFGVRTLEYLVERELGSVFAAASATGDVSGGLRDGLPPVLDSSDGARQDGAREDHPADEPADDTEGGART